MRINILHMYCAIELCTTLFFCIVLALYGVLCWFYCLNNTYNRSGHCDYACGTECSACVFCGILHVCTEMSQCTATSHISVLQHVCITMLYTLSCCIVHRSVCYGILFAITSHVPQHPASMYCMHVPQYLTRIYRVHSAEKKVVTQTDASFVILTDNSQENSRVHHTHKWKQNCV